MSYYNIVDAQCQGSTQYFLRRTDGEDIQYAQLSPEQRDAVEAGNLQEVYDSLEWLPTMNSCAIVFDRLQRLTLPTPTVTYIHHEPETTQNSPQTPVLGSLQTTNPGTSPRKKAKQPRTP